MIEGRGWIRSVIVVALLMLGFAIKGVLVEPPSPPTVAAASEFDTNRAIGRLQRILGDQRPHPVDTSANDAVRDRLIAELHAIGIQPEVHEADDCSDFPRTRFVSCSHVRNVVATIPGRTSGRHLLLDAHYDSTPTGPGAGDDGLGVATLLEVASILKSSPPARPVTLLFNEGEEFGLNGSSAFVRTDPLARQVNSLINIDARGVTGPALMFETSEPNGAALSVYGSGSRRPYGNSLTTDFAKLIPNSTDVVEFKPMNWTLLNYAIIGNETRYHSPGDTVAALDRASLYHVGSEVLALTRAMANMPEPAQAGSAREVFTDFAGRAFIHLPLPVAGGALAFLLVTAAYLAWREKALGKPLLVALAMIVAAVSASAFAAFVATLLRPGDFWRAYPLVTYLAVYAVLLAAMTGAWSAWGQASERRLMRAAAWLLTLIVGFALSLVVQGATIFFLFGPALALVGIALDRRSPQAANILVTAAILVQFLMFAQLLALIETLLIDGPQCAVSPLAAFAVLPVFVEFVDARPRPALALLVVVALGLWTAALVLPRSSGERLASFSIDYFRDADHRSGSWGIASKQAPLPASLPGTWRKDVLPYNGRTRWVADAPLLDTPTPAARLIASEPVGRGRRVRIALSPGGGDAVAIRFAEATRIVSLGLPGAVEALPENADPKKATLRCSGRSCEGFVFEAVLADQSPLRAELFSYRFSLPPQGQPLVAARPPLAVPQYSPDETVTMKRVRL